MIRVYRVPFVLGSALYEIKLNVSRYRSAYFFVSKVS